MKKPYKSYRNLITVLISFLVLETGCTNSSDLKKGLVAYYPFNGNANDESGNNNHGKINGASFVSDKFGNPGKALNFDGFDNSVEIPSSPSINITGSLSISCWICPHTSGIWESWVAKTNANGSKSQWRFGFGDPASGSFGLTIWNLGWGDYWLNKKKILLNSWSHVLLIADQNKHTVTYYLNGEFAGTVESIKNFSGSDGSLFIGHQKDDFLYFDGLIDEVRIYNRVLKRSEVRALYKNFKTSN